jgi:hypothetical protein
LTSRGKLGVLSPASTSTSTFDIGGAEVSTPSAVPERAPASGILSIGAMRLLYPDLTRLLETDSLQIDFEHQGDWWWRTNDLLPYFGNKVFNRIPGQGAVADPPPPT